jgi:fructose 1,6-bisphosphate aldolase/phosphatase
MNSRVTLSVFKADVGGYVGHGSVHPDMLQKARETLEQNGKDILIDFFVTHVGDDINIVLTHRQGVDAEPIHTLVWNTFLNCTEVAQKLKLYGAGQDLLSDAFSGNIKGMGPGIAEMEFEERPSEPIIIFMADKTEPGAWNFPLYKIFADPFNTIGLVIDPKMHSGFCFEVLDLIEDKRVTFSCPEELYDLLVFLGAPNRFVVKGVFTKAGEIAAISSTQKNESIGRTLCW